MSNEFALVPYVDLEKMGHAIAVSGLFGVKTSEQAIALMLVAQSEGLHPAIAARDYHVIQGKASMKSDAMLARFQHAGGSVKWLVLTDAQAKAEFSHPQGGSITVDWDISRAKTAGLAGKDMWVKYPRQMLRARVVSEGVRTVFPGCISGFYSPEEIMDGGPAEVPVEEKVIGGGVAVEEPKAAEPKKRGVEAMKAKLSTKKPAPDLVNDSAPISGPGEDDLSTTPLATAEEKKAFITMDQVKHLTSVLADYNIDGAQLLKRAKADALVYILAEDYEPAMSWLHKVGAAKAAAAAAEKAATESEL